MADAMSADEDRDAAVTLALLLDALGYDSCVTHDGVAALQALEDSPYDAALLDIGLPGLSGIEVAQRLRERLINPPRLIAVSGYGAENDRQASLAAGFCAHLTKPLRTGELAALLRDLFG